MLQEGINLVETGAGEDFTRYAAYPFARCCWASVADVATIGIYHNIGSEQDICICVRQNRL